ncbi:hypothetical protein [Chlamydia vaughanii]|uniref:hypothetical protein n=1 Tax=Chlamydia vaughanii TaxID=3112552 RepID=UPI0032B11ED5
MKCLPSCCQVNLENKGTQCCDVSESRARKIASIITVVVGVLLAIAGVVATVLFGPELGMLYSALIIGLSVAIGLVLLSIGSSCLTCRALVSKVRSSGFIPQTRYDDDTTLNSLKQRVDECKVAVVSVEEELAASLDQYDETKAAYAKVVGEKKQAENKMLTCKVSLDKAKENLNKAMEDGKSDTALQDTRKREDLAAFARVVGVKTNEYQAAVSSYNDVCKRLEALIPGLQVTVPLAKRLKDAMKELFGAYKSLLHYLDNRLVESHTQILKLTNKVMELESRIKELTVSGKTKDATITALEDQLRCLRKEREDAELAHQERLAALAKEKEVALAKLEATIQKLKTEKARGVLQDRIFSLETQLKEEKDAVASLEQQLRVEKEQAQQILQDQEMLRAELEERNLKIIALTEEVTATRALKIENENLKVLLQQEKDARAAEEKAQQQLRDALNDVVKRHDVKVNSLTSANVELQQTVEAQKQEVDKLKNTLVLYERLVTHFEAKLEKKKHKDLNAFQTAKASLKAGLGMGTSSSYTREQIGDVGSAELYKQITGLEEEVSNLKAQLEKQQKEFEKVLQEKEEELNKLKAELQEVKNKLERSLETSQTQANLLTSKEEELAKLRQQVVSLTKESAASSSLVKAMSMAMSAKQRSEFLAITGGDGEGEDKK